MHAWLADSSLRLSLLGCWTPKAVMRPLATRTQHVQEYALENGSFAPRAGAPKTQAHCGLVDWFPRTCSIAGRRFVRGDRPSLAKRWYYSGQIYLTHVRSSHNSHRREPCTAMAIIDAIMSTTRQCTRERVNTIPWKLVVSLA